MPSRQVLLPADDYLRLAGRLTALDHDIEPLLWAPDGVTLADGTSVVDGAGNAASGATYAPEAAWVSISLLFSGSFPAFVEAALAPGTLRWTQACLAGTDAPPFQQLLAGGSSAEPQ